VFKQFNESNYKFLLASSLYSASIALAAGCLALYNSRLKTNLFISFKDKVLIFKISSKYIYINK
jgi:hypothetical protein